MLVGPDIDRDTVIIDRIADVPVPAREAVAQVLFADETAVGGVHQSIRYGDADVHRVDLVAPLVLIRPPDAGALPLAGRVNPVSPFRVFAKREPAKAARLKGSPGVVKVDGNLAA